MMCTENLLPLVFSKPEIWDQSHMHYTNKSIKFKAWAFIADKLGVKSDVAKARWTNLRDLFRRELKKTLKMAEETGDSNAYKPRWKHFKSMMFLKDQIIKDESASSLQFDDSFSLYPQTILEDGEGKYDEEAYLEEESNPSSTLSHSEVTILPEPSTTRKRRSNNNDSNNDDNYHLQTFHPAKRQQQQHRWEMNPENTINDFMDYSNSRTTNEMDEDYHFVMSILPSVRRIRSDRKTTFKMKVLQLIVDEENVDAS